MPRRTEQGSSYLLALIPRSTHNIRLALHAIRELQRFGARFSATILTGRYESHQRRVDRWWMRPKTRSYSANDRGKLTERLLLS